MVKVGHAELRGDGIRCQRQGQAVALERVDRQVQAQGAGQAGAMIARGENEGIGDDGFFAQTQRLNLAGGMYEAGHRAAAEAAIAATGLQALLQHLAEAQAIGDLIAGAVDAAGQLPGDALQCRLQCQALGRIE
ncbi:hypothetical protein D9M68_857610 [compost metagenome]